MKYISFEQKGFTVLEMLIVLFIVVILIALALVSFNRARQQTRDRSSISDFQAIQLALEEYKAQCKVYPRELDPSMDNSFPLTAIASTPPCSITLGDVLPKSIDLSTLQYVPLSHQNGHPEACGAYHMSVQLVGDSSFLDQDDDITSTSSEVDEWNECYGGGTTVVESDDSDFWYDILHGVYRLP